jgi:hypothetical protein
MKKIAVLFLSAMMLFAIVTSSLAANSVSLGYMVNGECKYVAPNVGDFKSDAKNIILSGKFDINERFCISSELTDCDLKGGDLSDQATQDNRSYKIKGGYAIVQNEQVKLDLTAGYLYREQSFQNINVEVNYKTFVIGADAIFNLDENMNITTGFEYGLSPDGKLKNSGYKNDIETHSLLNYQVDFNYFVTENIGLSVGYHSSCWESKEFQYEDTIAGIVTAVTYKF